MVRKVKSYAKRGGLRVTQVPILLFPLTVTTQSRLFRFILGTKCSFSLSYLSLSVPGIRIRPIIKRYIALVLLHSFYSISPIPEFNEKKHC